MSLNLYRQYAARAPWNSKARREWLNLAASAEMQEARAQGRPFTPIDHKAAILESLRIGRDWYVIRHW